MKRTERIARIQKRLEAIDREVLKMGRIKESDTARIRHREKLLDRFDNWEARLAVAECQ